MIRARIVLLLLLLVATGAFAAEARRKVIFVGDSITFGEGVEPDQKFVHLLSIRERSVEMVNNGRSGWATSTYLKRQDEAVASIPTEAAVILIHLGPNDLRLDGHSEETVKQTLARLDKLADLIQQRAKGARVVILAPITVFPADLSERLKKAGFGPESPKYLKQLADAYGALAKRRGWMFVDLNPVVTAGNTSDGVHPNAKGHEQIAEAIWPTLKELLHADVQRRGGKGN